MAIFVSGIGKNEVNAMLLKQDKKIQISVGSGRWSKRWPVQELSWSEFVDKVSKPIVTAESFETYKSLPKTKQDEIKDVGGFVGGVVKDGGRRKPDNILSRRLVTLDADSIKPGEAQDIINAVHSLNCAYAIYSTKKHESAKPRLRIVIPLTDEVTAEEYEPIARKIADMTGRMEVFDPTTFEVSRLMYWPSRSNDAEFVFTYADLPWANGKGLLTLYKDWRDVSEWPTVPGAVTVQKRTAKKQGDPTEKAGVVGAFCKTYDVPAAIDKFLSDVYEECENYSDRYTYTLGSTVGGAVLYEDGKFLFSHHSTDPCSGRLVNAFDLVRLHKFGEEDEGCPDNTPTSSLPSYRAMQDFAVTDEAVKHMVNVEKDEKLHNEFDKVEDGGTYWRDKLKMMRNGEYKKIRENAIVILSESPEFEGVLSYDEIGNRIIVNRDLPWRKWDKYSAQWIDDDSVSLRCYMEREFNIDMPKKIDDAVLEVAKMRRINKVKDRITAEEWDGKPRLDTLFIDYLGAEDNIYTREVTRKSLCAAVARVYAPGIKYDMVPILVGAQGVGKTTLLAKLGGDYHTEISLEARDRDAMSVIQGKWIVEFGELKGMRKAELESVKQYISRTTDSYRDAYGHITEDRPRKCVFFGTTNAQEFLRDMTGNRRFMPIQLGVTEPTKGVFTDLDGEVNQIWAEALMQWNCGEKLILEGESAKIAGEQQEFRKEDNPKEGIIRDFLDKEIPEDWASRNYTERMMYWNSEFGKPDIKTVPRDRVCVLEIWCELFGNTRASIKAADSREINDIVASFPEWERAKDLIRCGTEYGKQRGYIRKGA